MSNHLLHLLSQWYPEKDNAEWVLGTVFKTEGPCYRKAGAMMLFNSFGQQLGMLSGGCLESDIQRHAKKVMATGRPMTMVYDSQDEDDLSFQLGIGCGGTVHIMLHPISANNDYLALDTLYQHLSARKSGHYFQRIPTNDDEIDAQFVPSIAAHHLRSDKETIASKVQEGKQTWLKTYVQPPVHLMVAGGGFDAIPLVNLAHQLGWKVTVWDPRPANARREYFGNVDEILRSSADLLDTYCQQYGVDAAIVMTHSVSLDASVLSALKTSSIRYLALLGPVHRKDEVLAIAKLSLSQFPCKLHAPAGLQLGAALPEGIAISMLSECIATLNNANAMSFSGALSE
ncbi:isoquinoline 1-oxidoreductase [Enterovibrio norvegicus FF-33]|uniref:XdhC family protein n=1 Tax=Enterovibrio norvegicus TaxID=188144 RepID=UPI0002FEFE38|nr:XdhC family protein [Enterovibrio norvegicus]OEE66856.1 isoquinoline 1-oxidoreductase [Enterovibrio norvegicus FF-33]